MSLSQDIAAAVRAAVEAQGSRIDVELVVARLHQDHPNVPRSDIAAEVYKAVTQGSGLKAWWESSPPDVTSPEERGTGGTVRRWCDGTTRNTGWTSRTAAALHYTSIDVQRLQVQH